MADRAAWMGLLAAFVTMCVVTLVGVVFWFRPIAEADAVGAALLPPAVNLLVYALLSILLFEWTARRIGPYRAAFVIGMAQYVLVVDLTLRGERGLATAGASAVLIVVTWASVAFVYSLVAGRKRS